MLSGPKRRYRSFAGNQAWLLSGTGFLLVGGRKCGPVTYHITVIEKQDGFACGWGRLEAAHALLLAAYQSYRFDLVTANGVELDASISALDREIAWVELEQFEFGSVSATSLSHGWAT